MFQKHKLLIKRAIFFPWLGMWWLVKKKDVFASNLFSIGRLQLVVGRAEVTTCVNWRSNPLLNLLVNDPDWDLGYLSIISVFKWFKWLVGTTAVDIQSVMIQNGYNISCNNIPVEKIWAALPDILMLAVGIFCNLLSFKGWANLDYNKRLSVKFEWCYKKFYRHFGSLHYC